MSEDVSRPLPSASDAEKSILSVMLQGEALHHIELAEEQGLQPSDFYVPSHGTIFEVLQSMRENGTTIELIGVVQTLKDRGLIDNVGGRAEIASIHNLQPTTAHFSYHLGLVKTKSTQRKAVSDLTTSIAKIWDAEPEHVDNEVAGAIQALQAIEERSQARADDDLDAKTALAEVMGEIESRLNGEPAPVIETSLANLNKAVGGGLGLGEITIIAARPSQGKTALALNFVQKAAKEGTPCHFVSIESAAVRLSSRMLSAEAGFSTNEIRKGEATKESLEQLQRATNALKGCPFWMRKLHNATALDVARVIRKRHRQSGTKLVVVDYLQLLKPHGNAERIDKRLCIDNALDVLCPLADQLGIALVLLAQLSRQAQDVPGRELKLSHLKESSRIEQDADLALLIGPAHDRESDGPGRTPKVISIPKNRDGETSFSRVQLHGPTTTFHPHWNS